MMRSGLILSGFYSNSMDNMYVFTVEESCQINHSRSSWVSLRPSSPPPQTRPKLCREKGIHGVYQDHGRAI